MHMILQEHSSSVTSLKPKIQVTKKESAKCTWACRAKKRSGMYASGSIDPKGEGTSTKQKTPVFGDKTRGLSKSPSKSLCAQLPNHYNPLQGLGGFPYPKGLLHHHYVMKKRKKKLHLRSVEFVLETKLYCFTFSKSFGGIH